jgi:Protein of unknown function (DUF3833)
MKRRLFVSAASTATLCMSAVQLTGCASQNVSDYAAEKPVLDLRQYFNGTLDAYGIFTNRSGKVVKRFTVVMVCTWQGKPGEETGVLDEDFTYSDGTKQKRVWKLQRSADGKYIGRADDVIGIANGQEMGNAFQWGYTLSLPVDGKVYEVQFDDWMYLIDNKTMLNKATMSKFGFKLGEVTLSFTKR